MQAVTLHKDKKNMQKYIFANTVDDKAQAEKSVRQKNVLCVKS